MPDLGSGMSWRDLAPAAAAPKLKTAHPVTLLVSKAGRFTQHATLTVRRDLMPAGMLGWWLHYEMVRVQEGDGPEAGRVRVMSGGPHRLTGPSGKPGKGGRLNAPHLKLYGLAGMPPVLGRQPVPWEMVGDTLIVTLPWSDAKGMAKVWPAVPSPAAKALAKPATALADFSPPQVRVLSDLHRMGGRASRLSVTSQADIKALRECVGKGLVEIAGECWQFTSAAQARFSDALDKQAIGRIDAGIAA